MARNIEINFIILLLVLLYFLTIINAHYKILNVQIKNGDEVIELKWSRTSKYLVNHNLPIWLAKKDSKPTLVPRIKRGMDKMITYQDVEKSSAVVYMTKLKVFYGIIDTRFYIIRLPFDQLLGPNIYHEVGNGYIFEYDKNNNKNNDENQGYYDDILVKLIEDEINAMNFIPNIPIEKINDNKNEIGSLYENLEFDDIIDELNENEINIMNSLLNCANEEENESEKYYDDIVANTDDENNTENPMTDSVNQDETEYQELDDEILTELTQDEINLINSVIDSTNIPTTSEPSSRHQIQHDVDHSIPSISGQASQIPPINEHENIEVHTNKLNTFYPEILLFVGNDVMSKFIIPNIIRGFQQLILYYIIYFNAVNMLFSKLATDTTIMHINIAGLVIEFEPGAFPYSISKSDLSNFGKTPQRLHADNTLFKFIKYINKHKNIFSEDSFDFFFLSTNHAIQKNGKILPAYSRSSADVYMQRKRNIPYNDLLGSIVHRRHFLDFIVATRTVAELLKIKYHSMSESLEGCGEHICNIMQETTSYSQNCLRWTWQSQYEFNVFFSTNENRCFLLNYPRSLRPYNKPAITIDSRAQCLCYGYNERTVNEVCPLIIGISACDKGLKCILKTWKNQAPRPLDGTPCDKNMVCWKKECVWLLKTRKRLPQNDILETDEARKKPRILSANW